MRKCWQADWPLKISNSSPKFWALIFVFKQPVAYWIRGSWLFFLRKLAEETKAIGELILLQRLDWIFSVPEVQNYPGLVPWLGEGVRFWSVRRGWTPFWPHLDWCSCVSNAQLRDSLQPGRISASISGTGLEFSYAEVMTMYHCLRCLS